MVLLILLINLIGVNSSLLLEIFLITHFYLKYFAYFSCSLAIFYQILIIILLHKFINKNIAIFLVLFDFIINWLNDIKTILSNIESTQYLKYLSHTHIFIYLVLICMFHSFNSALHRYLIKLTFGF